jgi:hypothetical protein
MQLGTALTSAVQHSWKSQVTHAALDAIERLLIEALHDNICFHSDSTPSSMGNSIRQQLQQSGVLQQLPILMAALAAGMRQVTAAITAGDWDAASSDVEQFTGFEGSFQWFATLCSLHQHLRELWEGQDRDIPADWLWGATGHADAAMQLVTAALQHVSAVVQRVLLVVQERTPQRADELVRFLQSTQHTARELCINVLTAVDTAVAQQEGEGSDGGPLQAVLQSPHMLTAVASVLVLFASAVNMAAHSAETPSSSSAGGSDAGGSSASGSSSPIGSSGSSSHPVQQEQQQQSAPHATASSSSTISSSSSSSSRNGAPTTCQLQLLQLLGLAPEMLGWTIESLSLGREIGRLFAAVGACMQWRTTPVQLSSIGVLEQLLADEQQQQRWQFEQRLWLLLPTVVLPSALALLTPSAQELLLHYQQVWEGALQQLLLMSNHALGEYDEGHTQLRYVDVAGTGVTAAPPAAGWVHELLGVVLQLANQMLYQQHPAPAAAAGSSAIAQTSGSSSSHGLTEEAKLACAGQLLQLMAEPRMSWQYQLESGTSRSSTSPPWELSSRPHRTYSSVSIPRVAKRLVKLEAAFEATLRAVAAAVQHGTVSIDQTWADIGPSCGCAAF